MRAVESVSLAPPSQGQSTGELSSKFGTEGLHRFLVKVVVEVFSNEEQQFSSRKYNVQEWAGPFHFPGADGWLLSKTSELEGTPGSLCGALWRVRSMRVPDGSQPKVLLLLLHTGLLGPSLGRSIAARFPSTARERGTQRDNHYHFCLYCIMHMLHCCNHVMHYIFLPFSLNTVV